MSITKDLQVWGCLSFWLLIMGPTHATAYDYVDAKAKGNTAYVTAPRFFDSDNSRPWRSLGNFLTSTKYSVYIISWQGYGGDVSIGKDFISYIERAKSQGKQIVFRMTGHSYSMHAAVACHATLVNPRNYYLMYHADSIEHDGKDYRQDKSDSTMNKQLDYCISAGLLTYVNVAKMWSGYEVYVNRTSTWYKKDLRPKD